MSGSEPRRDKRLRSEERVEVIFAAAARVFAEHGYDRASLREIAGVAGVTTPVVYDHFKSKADLYASTIERQANLLIAQWITPPAPETPAELFNSTTIAFFRAVSQSDQTWRLLFADRPSAPEAAEVHAQVQQYATAAVVASLRRLPRVVTPIDSDRAYGALAEAIKAAGHSLVAWWQDNKDVPIEQIAELNRQLVWDGLASMVVEQETPPEGLAGEPWKGDE